MKIGETFATTIQKIIEPVVKVSERRPTILLDELRTLVITPQWERYIHQVLQEYTDALDNEEEQGIGIWISGFFGSGKSLLMKTIGVLLEGGELEGQSVHEIFLDRLPKTSAERSDIERFLVHCQRRSTCTAIGGNVHAQLTDTDDALTLVAFRLFAQARGYTNIWAFAWGVEYQLDELGLLGDFQRTASDLCKKSWPEIAEDAEFYSAQLYEAAARVYPEHFSNATAVEQATDNAQRNGITPEMLIRRLRNWCANRDSGGKRHKLLLQFDELGQWLQGGLNMTDRIMQVQALVESAATLGNGRVWLAVTAHGDIQALKQSVQQENYAKINQRFALKCKLSNEDINTVVQERLLSKTPTADDALQKIFQQQSGELYDLGSLKETKRNYPLPDSMSFSQFYPYLPWIVAVIPDVTKGIAHAAGRGEELTGANRTMIGVVQGGILAAKDLLESPVGKFICLADLYQQFDPDVPLETRTDLRKVRREGNDDTTRVAHALYLLGAAEYIPCTLENIARCLISGMDTNLAALRPMVKAELERLVKAGYAKQVGDVYVFLSTQQRSFQEKVLNRQEELLGRTSDLILKLRDKDFLGDDALRFDSVTLAGREKRLRLVLDGSNVRNQAEHVTIQVFSPLQCLIAPELNNDAEMIQRSLPEQNTFFLRMAQVPELRRALAQMVATDEIAEQVMSSGQNGNPEYEVARQAKIHDVAEYKRAVRHYLAQAVRGSTLFFRGSSYYLTDGDNASAAVRNSLSQLLPLIYARFNDLPYRILDDTRAVKDALNNVISNHDLAGLKVFKADGTLNEGNALISTLRSRLPLEQDGMGLMSADQLRQDLEKPPFGWDSSCVKVGLALLLRASACHLIENGKTYTDPSNPEVLLMLTKEQRFKSLRVQGLRVDMSIQELQEIRGYMDTIFQVKPPLVTAMLNDKLKEQLLMLQKEGQEVENWAKVAQCLLPLSFESGTSLVAELLESNAPNVRLPHFLREWETLLNYLKLTRELLQFKGEHGKEYIEVRSFFTSMVHVDNPPEDVYAFLQNWRATEKERAATELTRWSALLQSYHAARQALTNQIAQLQLEAEQDFTELEKSLPKRVQEATIPEAEAEAALVELRELLRPLRERFEQLPASLSEARALKPTVMSRRMTVFNRIREIQERYQPQDTTPPTPVEVHMSWHNLLGTRRINSPDDLKQIMKTLEQHIYTELEQQRTVIIE